ncbi:MAG: hypothetical protein ABI806_14795, partial [Candidatus Solibacter sp.]
VSFTRFDTVLHSAATAVGLQPALLLTPDENRRTVVVVVDDVGLSPEGVVAVRETLRAAAGRVTASGGRMAILRASGGTGVLRQLSGDSRILNSAIDSLHYLGGVATPVLAGRATWQTLNFAIDGLAGVAGRKVVAVLTENPCGPAPRGAAPSDLRHAANLAGAAVYTLRPGGAAIGDIAAACPLAALARETGGGFGGELGDVLDQEQSYYAIGIAQDEDAIDPMGRWSAANPAEVKMLRAGITLRPRMGYVRFVPPTDSLLPENYAAIYNRALRSPFGSFTLRARLSAAVIDQRDTPVVQAALVLDPRDFTFTRDLDGIFHGGAMIDLIIYQEAVNSQGPLRRELKLVLKPDEMRLAVDKGILTNFELRLPGPGGWQVQAVVADEGSDRTGSAAQWIDVPDLRQSRFGIGGLVLLGDRTNDPTARTFRQGGTLNFGYTSINESSADRKAELEMQTRVLSGTRTVLEGAIFPVSFEEAPRGTRRQISGRLVLNDHVPPGDYILQVTVRDLLAPKGRSDTVVQVIDFQVR